MGKGLPGGRRQAGRIDYRTEPNSSVLPDRRRRACVLAGWLLQASCGAGWLHGCLILRLRPLAAGALPAAGWLLLLFPLFRLFDERSRTPNALRALRHPPPLLHLASYTRTLPAPP
jgi:hypothetical protein